MTSDSEIKAELMERLDAIAAMATAEVDIVVDNGMVTLNGRVDTHQTLFQIERVARNVAGLRHLKINISPLSGAMK
jgi:osmotically-inducible protein OsmY